MPVVGSVLEISRSEEAADFVWPIEASEIWNIAFGEWSRSPDFYFAGSKWRLMLGRKDLSGKDPSPVLLRLFRYKKLVPVRYWLGVRWADGEREEQIGSGTQEPKCLWFVDHPWMPFSELEKKLESMDPSSTLSIIIRLRRGLETDTQTKCPEAEAVLNSMKGEKSTQTDSKDFSNFSNTGRRYHFVPIEAEDLLNIMARQNK